MRSRPAALFVAALSVTVTALAGCSSGSAGGGTATTTAPAANAGCGPSAATPAAASTSSATSSSATTPASGGPTTSAAHKPVNAAVDLAVLDTITVTGDDPAKTPSLQFDKLPVNVSATAVKTLKQGSGEESSAGSKVTVRQALFLGKDGKQLDSKFESKESDSFEISDTQNTIPGLVTALTGVRAGSRILFAIPPSEAFGSGGRTEAGISGTDNLVVVSDVLSVDGQLAGKEVAPVAGLPTVTFDPGTGPESGPLVTVPKTAPPTSLVSQSLIEGAGPQVQSGQTLTANYIGVCWADNGTFDSSWTHGAPVPFPIGQGQVIPGWDKGLVGKTVGSRVLLVVPPADGYGDQPKGSIPANSTLVFVVDILDAS